MLLLELELQKGKIKHNKWKYRFQQRGRNQDPSEGKREDLTYHFSAHFAPLLETSQDAHKYHVEVFLEVITYIASWDLSASMGVVDRVVLQSSMDIS